MTATGQSVRWSVDPPTFTLGHLPKPLNSTRSSGGGPEGGR